MTKYIDTVIKFIKSVKKTKPATATAIYNTWYDCESCEYVKEYKIEVVIA